MALARLRPRTSLPDLQPSPSAPAGVIVFFEGNRRREKNRFLSFFDVAGNEKQKSSTLNCLNFPSLGPSAEPQAELDLQEQRFLSDFVQASAAAPQACACTTPARRCGSTLRGPVGLRLARPPRGRARGCGACLLGDPRWWRLLASLPSLRVALSIWACVSRGFGAVPRRLQAIPQCPSFIGAFSGSLLLFDGPPPSAPCPLLPLPQLVDASQFRMLTQAEWDAAQAEDFLVRTHSSACSCAASHPASHVACAAGRRAARAKGCSPRQGVQPAPRVPLKAAGAAPAAWAGLAPAWAEKSGAQGFFGGTPMVRSAARLLPVLIACVAWPAAFCRSSRYLVT